MTSVWALFSQTAARHPERPVLRLTHTTAKAYGLKPGDVSYEQLAECSDDLRRGYAAAGYGRGHRVMLLLENRPAFFAHFLALNALGASVVPVNPDLKSEELAYLAGDCAPALGIATPDRVATLAPHVPTIPKGAPIPPPAADAVAPEGEAALLYTSGTTGRPKGCVLGNEYFEACGRWYLDQGGLMAVGEAPVMLTPLPVFHMNALACSFMAMVMSGGTLVVLDRFHPRSWWADVRASQATCLHYLGVVPTILMGLPESPDERDHRVRFGFGAGVDPALHAPFEARFGFPLVEAWAMTETGLSGGMVASDPDRPVGEAAFGREGPQVEARILAEDGRPADEGELLVRAAGPDPRAGFFREYWGKPDATAEAWQGGWFHTGDVVRRRPDGYLTFVDRRKNVIRRSGENIAPAEIESVLVRHPAVASVAVSAVPDEVRGDEVMALVVTEREPTEARAREMVEWCLERLAYYKAPAFVAFVDALPLTGTQKVQRGALKTLAAELATARATHRFHHLKTRG